MRNALSPQAMVALIRSNTFITLRNLLQVSSPEWESPWCPFPSRPNQATYPRQTSFRLNISLRFVLRYASQIPFRFAWWRSAVSSPAGFDCVSPPGVGGGGVLAKMITHRDGAGTRRRGPRRYGLAGANRARRRYTRALTVNSRKRNGLAMKSLPPLMVELARLSKSLRLVTKTTGVVL
jgi:hypothetical protein